MVIADLGGVGGVGTGMAWRVNCRVGHGQKRQVREVLMVLHVTGIARNASHGRHRFDCTVARLLNVCACSRSMTLIDLCAQDVNWYCDAKIVTAIMCGRIGFELIYTAEHLTDVAVRVAKAMIIRGYMQTVLRYTLGCTYRASRLELTLHYEYPHVGEVTGASRIAFSTWHRLSRCSTCGPASFQQRYKLVHIIRSDTICTVQRENR